MREFDRGSDTSHAPTVPCVSREVKSSLNYLFKKDDEKRRQQQEESKQPLFVEKSSKKEKIAGVDTSKIRTDAQATMSDRLNSILEAVSPSDPSDLNTIFELLRFSYEKKFGLRPLLLYHGELPDSMKTFLQAKTLPPEELPKALFLSALKKAPATIDYANIFTNFRIRTEELDKTSISIKPSKVQEVGLTVMNVEADLRDRNGHIRGIMKQGYTIYLPSVLNRPNKADRKLYQRYYTEDVLLSTRRVLRFTRFAREQKSWRGVLDDILKEMPE